MHRDLKPENILINSQTLYCALADFGFALDLGDLNAIQL